MQVTCSGWRKHTSNMCPASGPKTLKCCYGPPGASAAYVRQISFPNARVWVWFFKNSRCSKLASEVTLTTILSSWTPCEEKSMQAPCSNKGGLISEGFLLKLKECETTLLNTIHLKIKCSKVWFGTFLKKDLSQIEIYFRLNYL